MIIAGLQKMTLLDYPGKVACTVFLQGCNFRCPFCHNSGLIGTPENTLSPADLLHFLKKRQGILDGVCITGGEPTLQPDLKQLLSQIKALGYSIKLDTNGSHPEVLKALTAEGLLDYVAMDIKNSPALYSQTTGIADAPLDKIEESMVFLMTGPVDYEFRTTVVEELHDEKNMQAMAQWLLSVAPGHRAKRLFLQSFVDRDSVLAENLHAPTAQTLAFYKKQLSACAEQIQLRGTE